jgi:two-component system KDP operon response regulator KdpE
MWGEESMKILLVEDDESIIETISLALQMRWPEAKLISTALGAEGVGLVEREVPDIVILDLGLPDISGFDVLKQVRAFSSVPVIILTVKAGEADIVKGLEWGADDYMVKPFRQLELLARLRALTRRQAPTNVAAPLVCGTLRFNPSTRQLFCGDREISITSTEAHILHHLMINAGRVVTHSSLAEAAWGEVYEGALNSLRVHIRRLREKLEADPDRPVLIHTKVGVGYLLAAPNK